MKKRPTNRSAVKAPRRRVAFLAVNASYAHANLADWYLRSCAGTAWEWDAVEAIAGQDALSALARLVARPPDVLAATLYLFNREAVLSIVRRYKQIAPKCVVVVGGPELLGDNRALMTAEPCINAAIRGEGEVAFAEFLAAADAPRQWRRIRGFCGFVDGKYVDTGTAKAVSALDDIPSPYASILARGFRKPFIQLETARGCRNRCSFCTSGTGGPVRRMSEARVRSDLEAIARAGVEYVRLTDRTFNDDRTRCISLVRMFRDDFPGMKFHLEIDPAQVGPALLAELASAGPGRFHLEVGVQSLCPRTLRLIGRRGCGSAKRTLETVRQLCALPGVEVHADLIAGLPGGRIAQVHEDLRALVAVGPDDIQLEVLKLLPGTRLSDDRRRLGLVASPSPPYEVLRTPDMDATDMLAAARLSRLVDWFYQPKALRPAVQTACRRLSSFWQDLCGLCLSRNESLAKPSLTNRFTLLHGFLDGRDPEAALQLQYAWMKCGLGPGGGICSATPWKKGIPAEAILVEGDASARPTRILLATLDHPYLFAYGTGDATREAVAVFRL